MGSNHMGDVMRQSEKDKQLGDNVYYVNNDEEIEKSEKANKELKDRIAKEPFLATPKEPKRKNQYLVNIGGLDVEPHIFQYVLRPTRSKNGWGDMEINMIDLVDEKLNQKIEKLLNRKKGIFGRKDWSLEIKIDETDPMGEVIETYLYDTELIKIEYGDLSYSMTDLSELKLILRVKSVNHKSN